MSQILDDTENIAIQSVKKLFRINSDLIPKGSQIQVSRNLLEYESEDKYDEMIDNLERIRQRLFLGL